MTLQKKRNVFNSTSCSHVVVIFKERMTANKKTLAQQHKSRSVVCTVWVGRGRARVYPSVITCSFAYWFSGYISLSSCVSPPLPRHWLNRRLSWLLLCCSLWTRSRSVLRSFCARMKSFDNAFQPKAFQPLVMMPTQKKKDVCLLPEPCNVITVALHKHAAGPV